MTGEGRELADMMERMSTYKFVLKAKRGSDRIMNLKLEAEEVNVVGVYPPQAGR